MTKLSTALLALVMLVGSVSLSGNNIFYKAESLHQALANAQSKGKLLLTYAARSSAPCCRAMENATFQHPEVIDILEVSFYPIKINLSNAIGQRWATEFQIVNTPTLLFFDAQGTLIKQVENGLSSTELLSILQDVLFFSEKGYWPMEAARPVVLTAYVPDKPMLEKPPTDFDQRKEKVAKEDKVLIPNKNAQGPHRILLLELPTNDPSLATTIQTAKEENPLHTVKVTLLKKEEKRYFQVWLGDFKEYPAAQVLLNDLQTRGFDEAVIISSPHP